MALTAFVHWRVTTDGAEINGGGFDPSLTAGMLTDGAATSATGTAPVFTSATYTFVAGDVGAHLYIAAGTNWTPGWYPIASVAGGAATLTASIDATLNGARKANGNVLTANGCATTASPTGATFTIDYSAKTATPIAYTDLVSTASTTVNSLLVGFTPVMVGNIIRLASATGTPVVDANGSRYLAIVTYTDANNVVVDKTSGTYTAGVAKVGGAHVYFKSYSNGGSQSAILSTPLLPGHTIDVKGAGSEDPSGVDYAAAGNAIFPIGSQTTGLIYVKGYNGRPHVQRGAFGSPALLRCNYIKFLHMKFSAGGALSVLMDVSTGSSGIDFEDCIFDQNGFDSTLSLQVNTFHRSWAKNTGSTSAGTLAAVGIAVHGGSATASKFSDIRGWGVSIIGGQSVYNCIFTNNRLTTKGAITSANAEDVGSMIVNCTFDGNQGDGILLTTKTDCWFRSIFNNLFTNNVGYGLNANISESADPFFAHQPDYNAYYLNTAGARQNATAGAHDVTLTADPYTNRAGGVLTLNATAGGGAACKGAAMGPVDPGGSTVASPDTGALQV